MSLYQKVYNKDNVTQRNIIVALLHTLNKAISFKYIDNDVQLNYNIPFYYSMGGSERFLYDMFMKPLFDSDTKSETHYEKVPRGIITYESSTINKSSLSNPSIYARYNKRFENSLRTYKARLRALPMTMTFKCEIFVSSQVDMFRVNEELMKIFYDDIEFQVQTERIRVPAVMFLPDAVENERIFEYSFDDIKKTSLSFSFDVFSYIPVFDDSSEVFINKNMSQGINQQVDVGGQVHTYKTTPPDKNVENIPRDKPYFP